MEARLGQIDMNTGELYEHGFVAYVPPKRRNGFGDNWVALSQSAALALATSGVSKDTLRVFLGLLRHLEFENLLVLNQTELGKELGIHRRNIGYSMKTLTELGILLQGPRIGITRSFRLNPEFGWKGTAKNHVNALDYHHKQRAESVVSPLENVEETETEIA